MQIEATNWPPANEIDACNDDLVVAITKAIAEHTNSTGSHLIASEDYLNSNSPRARAAVFEREPG